MHPVQYQVVYHENCNDPLLDHVQVEPFAGA
jgi:hypothetical protein